MIPQYELDRFLGRPYKYENGPVTSDKQVEVEGGNCQRQGHDAYRAWFTPLPKGLWSEELYTDEKHVVRTVSPDEESHIGDIYLFGKDTMTNPKTLHWAIFIGNDEQSGEQLLLHANAVDGETAVWPISRFSQHQRYETLHARKRLQPELHDVFVASQYHMGAA